ncbi:DUF5329 family protein [Dokdonella soli]|uniref:DUF5329 domain-containing protein n=1 Tax=Dokdonella soli TaxID=529810 RepID=A0ABN1IDZ2_9GAMM
MNRSGAKQTERTVEYGCRKRSRLLNKVVVTWIFFAALVTPAFGQQAIEQQKIAYLIASVAALHDATFIRNDNEYDAERAAEHLRLKLRYASDRVRTAEDFIAYCGTGSSMSGIKYEIRFRDGRTIESATFLHYKLVEYETKAADDVRGGAGAQEKQRQ